VGFGSHALDTTEDVLGLTPVRPSPVRRRRGPSARRWIPGLAIRKEHEADSASVGTEAGRACLRV